MKSNCYILSDGDEVIVIDPGEESLKIDAEIKKRSSDPKLKILITHGHIDQIYSTCFLVEKYPNTLVYAGRAENLFLYDSNVNLSRHMGLNITFTEISTQIRNVATGDEVNAGKYSFRVVETPGHTPGSVMFILDSEETCFCGDTILKDAIGGTNLPFGDATKLFQSIRERVLVMNNAYKLCPAHGESTDIAQVKRNNPYVLAMSQED